MNPPEPIIIGVSPDRALRRRDPSAGRLRADHRLGDTGADRWRRVARQYHQPGLSERRGLPRPGPGQASPTWSASGS